MKRSKSIALWTTVLLLAVFSGNVLATEMPNSAAFVERIWNDSFASTLTLTGNYPSQVAIDDVCAGPLGWANLHAWRCSVDGTTPLEFSNTDGFAIYADLTLSGTGNGEAGLQVRPWWSEADGRFNVRTPDGEVACFGGRLPFYSFTAEHGVSYVKGTTVRVGIIYTPNAEMNATMPATIEYVYESFTSGPLPFDEGNAAEGHGTWGMLSPSYVGGYSQFNDMVGAGDGANFNADWSNISFSDLGSVVANEGSSWGGVKALYR